MAHTRTAKKNATAGPVRRRVSPVRRKKVSETSIQHTIAVRKNPLAVSCASLLVLILLLAPVLRVSANEGSSVSETPVEEVTVESSVPVEEMADVPPADNIEEGEMEDSTVSSEEMLPDQHTPPAEEVALFDETVTSETSSTTTFFDTEDSATTTDGMSEDSATTTEESVIPEPDETATTTATTTEEYGAPEDIPVEDGGNEEIADENVATTTDSVPENLATTTDESVVPVNEVTNDQNRFKFGEHECVPMGDGSFYCNETDAVPVSVEDGVFSIADAGGDKEIYIVKNGDEAQVTNNDVDDEAPFYDQISKRIVWHTLTNDRYQVMSYDLETGEATQLTNETYNSMEPTAYDDATVWQAWIENNWEIILLVDGEATQLTDNGTHDIAPNIRGNYILWQSYEDGAWSAKVYDRGTGLVNTIDSPHGASVENPRFVLVYDSKDEHGDVATLGYDFESGDTVPLSALPASVPKELPEPEQTGEERALVSPSNNSRTEHESPEHTPIAGGNGEPGEDVSSTDPVITPPQTDDTATSTPESVPTVVDDTATTTEIVDPELVLEPEPVVILPEEGDLIIPPYSSSEHATSTE